MGAALWVVPRVPAVSAEWSALAVVQHAPSTGPIECEPDFEVHGVDTCSAESTCLRYPELGDVELTELSTRSVRCRPATSGWLCECDAPVLGIGFEVPSGTSDALCLDARDWCAGQSVETSGNRDCAWHGLLGAPEYCSTNIVCAQDVLIAGQEATMYESFPLECVIDANHVHACACPLVGSFVVYGDGSEAGCLSAAEICAAGQ